MNIGERIKARRKELGMSAETLAEKIGKSPATVYRYENGDISGVDSRVLLPIADALRTTPGYLMGWDKPVDMFTVKDGVAQNFTAAEKVAEAAQAREELADDPDRKALLNLARYGSAKDVKQVAALIDALRATNSDFYDGDDPA